MPGENNSREDFALVVADMTKGDQGADNGDQGREVVTVDADTGREVEPTSRERDEGGRFVARQPADDKVSANKEPQPKTEVTASTPAPKPGALVAPVSWKPEERLDWPTLTPKVQATILRREREMDNMLRTTAEARQFKGEFDQMIQPWLPMIQSENSTPLHAANHLFQMAAYMRTGPAVGKAQEIAKLIATFDIDPALVDKALTQIYNGQAPNLPAQPSDQMAAIIDQRLAPIMAFMRQMQGMQQATDAELTTRAQSEMDAFFADPANEFANDVRNEMGVLLMSYAEAGLPLSLSEAYSMATMRNPEIAKILQSKQKANGAAQQTAAARRALEAAASISSGGGSPSQGGEDESDGSLRSDIASAWRTVANRR